MSPSSKSNIFATLGDEILLVMRLMADPRVPLFLKLIPIGTLVYFIVPVDLLPGPFDDAAVVGMGLYLFIELCPPDIVAEHRHIIRGQDHKTTRNADFEQPETQMIDEDQIVEGEFREEQ